MTTTIMDRATCRIHFGNGFCVTEPQYTLFKDTETPTFQVMDIRRFIDTKQMRNHLIDLGYNLGGRRILHILAYHPNADGFINRLNYDIEYFCSGEGDRRRWYDIEENEKGQWSIAHPTGNIIIVVNH